MLVILPFEKAFYQKWNYEVEYVGHPLVEVVALHVSFTRRGVPLHAVRGVDLEIAPGEITQPANVPHRQRPVDPQLFGQRLAILRLRVLRQERRKGVLARVDPAQRERERRQGERHASTANTASSAASHGTAK